MLHRHGAGLGGGSWSCSSLQDRPRAGGDPGSGSTAEGGPLSLEGTHPITPPPGARGQPGKAPMECRGCSREGLQGDGPVAAKHRDVLVPEG